MIVNIWQETVQIQISGSEAAPWPSLCQDGDDAWGLNWGPHCAKAPDGWQYAPYNVEVLSHWSGRRTAGCRELGAIFRGLSRR